MVEVRRMNTAAVDFRRVWNTTDTRVRISFAHLLQDVTTYFHSRGHCFESDKLNFILVENSIAVYLPILMLVIIAL